MRLNLDDFKEYIKKWDNKCYDSATLLNALKHTFQVDDRTASIILLDAFRALLSEYNYERKISIDKGIRISALKKWLNDAREKANRYNNKYLMCTNKPLQKIAELNGKLKQTQIKLNLALGMLRMSDGEMQVQYLKNGGKIARKDNVTLELIERLSDAGLSDANIAKQLGVSKSTIYRRRHEKKHIRKLNTEINKNNDGLFED